jgi:hypothetical protein
VILIIACGQTAFAQATRPYRALFGGSTVNPDVHHSFDVTASVEEGYEDGDLVDDSLAATSPLLTGGVYSAFSANVSYAWRSQRLQVAANGGSTMRYYPDEGEFLTVGHSAAVGFSAQLTERMRVFANQSVAYAPSFLFGVMPVLSEQGIGDITNPGGLPDSNQSVYVYDTNASVTFGLARRGSLEALTSYRYSDLGSTSYSSIGVPPTPGGSADPTSDLRSYSVGGRYRHGLTRNMALRIGYIYRNGTYGYGVVGGNGSTAIHDIDTGIDYRRALSFTRRTRLDFGVGSAIINTPQVAAQDRSLQYRVGGNVGLTHEVGRTWRARLAYNRGVGFVEAFTQPVFLDAVTGSLAGFFSRRIDFSATGGYSFGDVGLGATPSQFRGWSTSTRLRIAANAHAAVYAEYFYYYHNLGEAVLVPTAVPQRLDRQSIRVGVSLWTPLLRR